MVYPKSKHPTVEYKTFGLFIKNDYGHQSRYGKPEAENKTDIQIASA